MPKHKGKCVRSEPARAEGPANGAPSSARGRRSASARRTGETHSQLNASDERPSDHAVAGSSGAAAGVGTDSAASTSGGGNW